MKPRRIQLRRTKGWRKPANTVVVARPTKWGNPFRVQQYTMVEVDQGLMAADAVQGICVTAEATVNKYRRWLKGFGRPICRDAKEQLRGKNLACWCKLHAPCHADVLLELANS